LQSIKDIDSTLILDSLESIVVVCNEGEIVWANSAFFEFFDEYESLEEFKKEFKSLSMLFEKEEGFFYLKEGESFKDALKKGGFRGKRVKIYRDFEASIFSISAKPLSHEGYCAVTLNDITDFEEAKERLTQSNILLTEYKKAVDESAIVSKTDKLGYITYVNERFCKISGYSPSELMGQNHNIVRHPDMPKVAFKLAWDLIQSGKEFFGFVKNLRRLGGYYWVYTNIQPDYNSSGKIVGYTSVRRKPNPEALDTIIPLYQQLISAEKTGGMDSSYAAIVEV